MNKELFLALKTGPLPTNYDDFYQRFSEALCGVTFEGDSALHIAAREGHQHIVDWILRVNPSMVQDLNKSGETALIIVCKYGHEQTVTQLLEASNSRTETHQSPCQEPYKGDATSHLHTAVYGGHLEITKIHQSPSQEPHKGGATSHLHAVVHGGHLEITETHQSPSQEPYKRGATSHLRAAVHGGRLEIVKAILNHRADDRAWHNDLMTDKDRFGRCAVHVAAMKGRWDIINEFISKRPDCIEILSSDHKSALLFAVENNRFKVVKNLLKWQNELSDHDHFHNTALHLAAKNVVDLRLLDLLLSVSGVDVNAMNDEGMTAFDIASAAAQHNPNWATNVQILEYAGAKRSRPVPLYSTTPDDIVNTHMVVASLIATVTFAAMFQIPGGIEDDKNSIHYGAAKLAFHKLFRLFIFSDTAAFTASLTVVVAWLLRQQMQKTRLGSSVAQILSLMSEANLLVSIFCTVVAFVSATMIVIIPHDYEKLKSKDEEAFSKYRLFWQYEISLATITPYLAAATLSLAYSLTTGLQKTILKDTEFLMFTSSKANVLVVILFGELAWLAILILCFTFK